MTCEVCNLSLYKGTSFQLLSECLVVSIHQLCQINLVLSQHHKAMQDSHFPMQATAAIHCHATSNSPTKKIVVETSRNHLLGVYRHACTVKNICIEQQGHLNRNHADRRIDALPIKWMLRKHTAAAVVVPAATLRCGCRGLLRHPAN